MPTNPVIRVYCEPYTYMERGMVVNWHRSEASDKIYYRKEGTETWLEQNSTVRDFPSRTEKIHRVVFTDLEPDTIYQFRFDNDGETVRKFKTFPKYHKPMTIVHISDHQQLSNIQNSITLAVNAEGMAQNPDLVVFNGDFVMCEGFVTTTNGNNWATFMNMLCSAFIYEDGLCVPMIFTIANHEVDPHYAGSSHTTPANYNIALFHFYTNGADNRNNVSYGYFTAGAWLLLLCPDANDMIDYESSPAWFDELYNEFGTRYPYAIVYCHHTPYPHQPTWNHVEIGPRLQRHRRQWLQNLQRFNFRFFHTGHEHLWFQTHPVVCDADNLDGRRDDTHPQAIVYTGAGGWSNYGRQPRMSFDVSPNFYVKEMYGNQDGTSKLYHAFYTKILQDKILVNSVNNSGTLLADDYVREIVTGRDKSVMFSSI